MLNPRSVVDDTFYSHLQFTKWDNIIRVPLFAREGFRVSSRFNRTIPQEQQHKFRTEKNANDIFPSIS
jgi:hypothetical protein